MVGIGEASWDDIHDQHTVPEERMDLFSIAPEGKTRTS